MSEQSVLIDSRERFSLFIELYKKSFPAVARYISRKGGTYEEAKDLFQDALILYYEKRVSSSFAPVQNEQAYILGIARHLWFKRIENRNNTDSIENATSIPDEQEDVLSSGKILRLLETAGQKCMELLKAFYYDKTPLSAIAQQLGYSGTRSATVQKYKCIEKIRETVKEKSLVYEDFTE
mgnify:CR=1 FL=1|jgi:RNA polymerase sigma factor (sigma-70 family)